MKSSYSLVMREYVTGLRSLSTKIPHLRACSLATQWLAAPGGLPTAAMAGQRAAEDAIRALCKKHSFALTLPHAFRIPHAE